MRKIFLDTFYLKALADRGDNAHRLAISMVARLGNFRGVTSEMVLTELLNALCSRGEFLRKSAIRLTHDLRNDSKTIIIPQTSEQFQQAFDFYQRRLDKGYSHRDCIHQENRGFGQNKPLDRHSHLRSCSQMVGYPY